MKQNEVYTTEDEVMDKKLRRVDIIEKVSSIR